MESYGGPPYGQWEHGQCHIGPVKVLTIGKANIWAGRRSDMQEELDWELRLRFQDETLRDPGQLLTADDKAKALLSKEVLEIAYPPTLDISWPDFGSPPLHSGWWKALVKDLRGLGPANVGIYCYGGHGRTGTALSILAGLTMPSLKDPVAWVRKNYCDEAVESWMQVNYIAGILGRKIASTPTSIRKGKWVTSFGNSQPVSRIKDDVEFVIEPLVKGAPK